MHLEHHQRDLSSTSRQPVVGVRFVLTRGQIAAGSGLGRVMSIAPPKGVMRARYPLGDQRAAR